MATPLLRVFRAAAPGVAAFAQTAATGGLLAAASTRPWAWSGKAWASRSFQSAAFSQGERGGQPKNADTKKRRGKREKSIQGELLFKLNMACKVNDLAQGLEILEEIKAAGLELSESAHERMLYLYSKNGRLAESESTFKMLESIRPKVPENRYIMLMQAYAASGMLEQAFQVMGQMKDKDIDLRLRAYNSVMPALVSGPDGIESALQLLGDMDKQSVLPDSATFAPMFEACTRAQEPSNRAKGFAVLWEMRQRGVMVAPKDMQSINDWFTRTKPMGVEWKVEQSTISESGQCKCCGQKLEELLLPSDRLTRLANEIKELVHRRGIAHQKELAVFERYLADYGPFDLIVDGMNVGCWCAPQKATKRGPQRSFNCDAIVDLANQLQAQGVRPLVLLRNHIARWPSQDMKNRGWDRLQSLEAAGRLFYVADGTPDDLYFLHGALNSNLRAGVVTNDLMRDHKLTVEKHSLEDFLKWQRSCQVRFHYDLKHKRAVLHSPQVHDYVVQHSEDGSKWHIPPTPAQLESNLIVSGGEDKWLCAQAKTTT
eukprot:comp22435_c0_seq1/m.33682 comp22435_c0_seq1/g.33682  ORF comp22435_c0_seq1/g.33682 comp22435_c0_seq1/m.33682 type:complete len:543 (-) comp22435_c0_seq1:315-1943(-)